MPASTTPLGTPPPVSAGPVRVLVGPTAAGKTEAAVALAERIGAEIVTVDAYTLYRGMDVGTSTPSTEQRRRVPHHLVNVLEPVEESSAAWFQRAARETIRGIHARGRPAVLVGGSGLYLRATIDALAFPPRDDRVRARLTATHAADPAGAHAELSRRDPDAAARIEPNNLRRTVRALEVIEITGRAFSSFRTAWAEFRAAYDDVDIRGIALDPSTLARRIDQRVEDMLAAGWLAEAQRLLDAPRGRTASRAIGYAELWAMLRGELDEASAVERIRTRTRRYAARQRRWFARDPRIRWGPAADVVEGLAR